MAHVSHIMRNWIGNLMMLLAMVGESAIKQVNWETRSNPLHQCATILEFDQDILTESDTKLFVCTVKIMREIRFAIYKYKKRLSMFVALIP